MVDENGQVFVQSQHPAPDRDAGDHRPRARPAQQPGDRAVPADGRRVRRQGDAAARARGGRRAGRDAHRAAGPAAAHPQAGHDDDRQAARRSTPPGEVGFDDDGRFGALEATLTSDGGWSLDLSEPVLSRALCHVDNAYWIPDVRVHGRIAKTNKTSQTAFRGFGGPQGMLVIEDIIGRCAPAARDRARRRCGAATSTSRARPRLRPAGPPPRAAAARLGPGPSSPSDVDAPPARDRRRSTTSTRTPSAAWRSRR